MSNYTIEKSTHKAYEWLHAIAEHADWYDENCGKSMAALRAVLHELRDHLPLQELAHLSAQLPLLIRGILFEEWNPNKTPIKERTTESFIGAVTGRLANHPANIEPSTAIDTVFYTLSAKLPPGEVGKLLTILPKGIRSFFEKQAKNYFNIE